jgi:P27 family predicted phage terminase small subunit
MAGFEILDKVDEESLAIYCDAVARYREAAMKIREEGYTTTNAQGGESVSPYVRASQSYARIMMQYADKLGLTPNSRARLAKKIADENTDPNADLFD